MNEFGKKDRACGNSLNNTENGLCTALGRTPGSGKTHDRHCTRWITYPDTGWKTHLYLFLTFNTHNYLPENDRTAGTAPRTWSNCQRVAFRSEGRSSCLDARETNRRSVFRTQYRSLAWCLVSMRNTESETLTWEYGVSKWTAWENSEIVCSSSPGTEKL